MRAIEKAIVHCAATPNGKSFDVKDIDNWHKERGFNKSGKHSRFCGYHYVIKVDGVIEKGRLLNEVGAHCKGLNSNSIGICLIGTDNYSEAQMKSLELLLVELKALFPQMTIHGHNEFSTKSCPGFNVQDWIKTL